MKKMMALAMAAVMAMAALTGCGGSGSGDSANGDVPVIGISQYGQHASMIPSHSRSLRTSPQTM